MKVLELIILDLDRSFNQRNVPRGTLNEFYMADFLSNCKVIGGIQINVSIKVPLIILLLLSNYKVFNINHKTNYYMIVRIIRHICKVYYGLIKNVHLSLQCTR